MLAGLVLVGTALAQESASFKLNEHVLNAGGHPADGAVLTSASFRVSLDSLGDNVVASSMSSDSFALEGGFPGLYPPPGPVDGLRFASKTKLEWNAEKSSGSYNLYRDLQSNLLGLGFGDCEQQELMSVTTMDTDAVPSADGYFYLVTVENLLGEEGTKGLQSDTTERLGMFCP